LSRATIIIRSEADRAKALDWVRKAPVDTRVEFRASKRTLPQNDRMWAMLTDFSEQLPWHGVKLKTDYWKLIFLDALKRETRIVPNIDGDGFVDLGHTSSRLSKEEMSDMIELMFAFGANNNVNFSEPVSA
jgi:hypothetical protein